MMMQSDSFPSFGDLQEANDDLLRRLEQFADAVEAPDGFWAETTRFLQRAQETGVLFHPISDRRERRATQSILDFWANAMHRVGRPSSRYELAAYVEDLAPELPDEPCPYQGLAAFSEADKPFFFGRETLVKEMLQLLSNGQRLLLVIGRSGSGKSSLVQAGLVPALRSGALPGSQDWVYASMVPGSDPEGNLRRALRNSGVSQESEELLPPGDARPRSDQPLVLVIDQFEEIFTLDGSTKTLERRLIELASIPKPAHILILTVRQDFDDQLARMEGLYAMARAGRVDVGPLSGEELRAAILGPAESVHLKIEDQVVADLVDKILGEKGRLPLLQFTLLKLWEERSKNRITWDVYQRVGDPLQALERCAEGFYEGLPQEERVIVEELLLLLVQPGVGSTELMSRRIPVSETFAKVGKAQDRVEAVLLKISCQARLLKFSGADCEPCQLGPPWPAGALWNLVAQEEEKGNVLQIEVAHEALVRNWPRFEKRLTTQRQRIETRRKWETRAENWIRLGCGQGGLLDAVELRETENWLASSDASDLGYAPIVDDLVQASRRAIEAAQQEKEASRLRELWLARAVAALFVVLVLIVAIFAALAYRYGRESTLRFATMLAYDADEVMVTDPPLAVVISAEAVDMAYRRDAPWLDAFFGIDVPDEISRSLKEQTRRRESTDQGDRLEVLGLVMQIVSVSPDRLWIAAASGGEEPGTACEVLLWHVNYTEPISPTLIWELVGDVCVNQVKDLRFDRDSTKLALILNNGLVDVVDLDATNSDPPDILAQIPEKNESRVQALAISPSLEQVAVSNEAGNLKIVETDSPQMASDGGLLLRADGPDLTITEFSPDEEWLVSVDISKTLHLWRLSPAPFHEITQTLSYRGDQLVFDSSGRWLAVASREWNAVYVVDLSNVVQAGGRAILDEKNAGCCVHSIAFQHGQESGNPQLAIGYEDGRILFVDLSESLPVAHDPTVATQEAIPSTYGIPPPSGAESTEPKPVSSTVIFMYPEPVEQLAFGEQMLVSINNEGTARIWKLSELSDPSESDPVWRGTLYSIRTAFFGADQSNQVYATDGDKLVPWEDFETPDAKEIDRLLDDACDLADRVLDIEEKRDHLMEDPGYDSVCARLEAAKNREGDPSEVSQ